MLVAAQSESGTVLTIFFEILDAGFTPLVANIGLIAVLAWSFAYLRRRQAFGTLKHNAVLTLLTGLSSGLTAVLSMNLPIEFQPGIFGDARAVPVLMSGVIGGPLSAVITALMAATMRLYIGGAGALTGVIYIAWFGLVGGIASIYFAKHEQRVASVGKLVALMTGATIVSPASFALLPPDVWQAALLHIWPVMAVANVLGTVVIATLVQWDRERERSEVELSAREAMLTAVLNGSVDAIFQLINVAQFNRPIHLQLSCSNMTLKR